MSVVAEKNCPFCKKTKNRTDFYPYRAICKKCYYKKQEIKRKEKNKTIPKKQYDILQKKYEELENKYKELMKS